MSGFATSHLSGTASLFELNRLVLRYSDTPDSIRESKKSWCVFCQILECDETKACQIRECDETKACQIRECDETKACQIRECDETKACQIRECDETKACGRSRHQPSRGSVSFTSSLSQPIPSRFRGFGDQGLGAQGVPFRVRDRRAPEGRAGTRGSFSGDEAEQEGEDSADGGIDLHPLHGLLPVHFLVGLLTDVPVLLNKKILGVLYRWKVDCQNRPSLLGYSNAMRENGFMSDYFSLYPFLRLYKTELVYGI